MEVKERVINVVAEKLGINKLEVKENKQIINDFGADSLDVVEIVMGIEHEFGITIADDELNGIKTVKDLIDKVENKRRGR